MGSEELKEIAHLSVNNKTPLFQVKSKKQKCKSDRFKLNTLWTMLEIKGQQLLKRLSN